MDDPVGMAAPTSIIAPTSSSRPRSTEPLRPLNLTFARYEVLMLLSCSSRGALPVTKVGERLMVHPTGITELIESWSKKV